MMYGEMIKVYSENKITSINTHREPHVKLMNIECVLDIMATAL
jgi:hypothetical protein